MSFPCSVTGCYLLQMAENSGGSVSNRKQWFSAGLIWPSEDSGRSGDILVVMTEGMLWQLVVRGQGRCPPSCNAQDRPHHEELSV